MKPLTEPLNHPTCGPTAVTKPYQTQRHVRQSYSSFLEQPPQSTNEGDNPS